MTNILVANIIKIMTEFILECQNISGEIGGNKIINAIDFKIKPQSITMIYGHNGAGKTTILRHIMGIYHPSNGKIIYKNQDITNIATAQLWAKNIRFVPENQAMIPSLSTEEYILCANHWQINQERLAWLHNALPIVKQIWQQKTGTLSGGQQQIIAIFSALITPCDLLILDEPLQGLAPDIAKSLINLLKTCQNQGTTILWVEKQWQIAQQMANWVILMAGGRVIAQDAPHKFEKSPC